MWELVEADLHQLFHLDLEGLPDRNWRWLRLRVLNLLTETTSRTYRSTVNLAQRPNY